MFGCKSLNVKNKNKTQTKKKPQTNSTLKKKKKSPQGGAVGRSGNALIMRTTGFTLRLGERHELKRSPKVVRSMLPALTLMRPEMLGENNPKCSYLENSSYSSLKPVFKLQRENRKPFSQA